MSNIKYLVSGATGFLGKFILSEIGSDSFDTIGRGPSNTIKFDFSKVDASLEISEKYDFLIIASGHAHVSKVNHSEMQLHYAVNLKGTQQLVNAVNIGALKGVVYISSIAVYGENMVKPFTEQDDLIGESPYAKSKVAAENYLQEWSIINNVPVLILRVPLIAGTFPPGNLKAMIEAIRIKRYFSISHGKARRSIVLADDLANFIVKNCGKHGVYNLSDGFHPSYRELEVLISRQLNVPPPLEIHLLTAKIFAFLGDKLNFIPLNSSILKKLVQDLIVDDSKARIELGWSPRSVVKNLIIK
jgi:nucleoside-diphosphate-sugar epimerase